VREEKYSIKNACIQFNVNYSTGKLIVRKYKVEGKITMFSYEKDDLSNVRPL